MRKPLTEHEVAARGGRDLTGARFQPPKRPAEERLIEVLVQIRDALNRAEPEGGEAADLKALVAELARQTAALSALAVPTGYGETCPYVFDIKRDGSGFIQQVIVTPETQVTH